MAKATGRPLCQGLDKVDGLVHRALVRLRVRDHDGGSVSETDRLVVSCPVMCCVQGLAGGFAEEQPGSVRVRTVRKLPHAGLWGPRGAMWRARRAPIRRPLCCKTEARSAFSRSWTCVFECHVCVQASPSPHRCADARTASTCSRRCGSCGRWASLPTPASRQETAKFLMS